MFTQIEKMTDCEFSKVDPTSAPCHNPPVFIDRKGGHVVCVAHADSLEVALEDQHAKEMVRLNAELDAQVKLNAEIAKVTGKKSESEPPAPPTPPIIPLA